MTVVAKLTKADPQCCNVFVITFIKHMFKQRDVLNIGCLVEKVVKHIVLIWTIKCNVRQVTLKFLKVWTTWNVVEFLEFYNLHLYRLQKHQYASSNAVYHQYFYLVVHSFVFSKKVSYWVLLELTLPYTENHHSLIVFTIWS